MPCPGGRRGRWMKLMGFSRPCAISSASERCAELERACRLTGSLHFPARKTNAVGHVAVTLRSWGPRHAASFVVQAAPLVGAAPHFERFLKGIVNCHDGLDQNRPAQRSTRG